VAVIPRIARGHRDAWTGCTMDTARISGGTFARLLGAATVDVAMSCRKRFWPPPKSAPQFDESGTYGAGLTGMSHHQVSNYWPSGQKEGSACRIWFILVRLNFARLIEGI